MAPARDSKKAGRGRRPIGTIEIRPFKNGTDASFWLKLTVNGQRRSRRLGLASEGWNPPGELS